MIGDESGAKPVPDDRPFAAVITLVVPPGCKKFPN